MTIRRVAILAAFGALGAFAAMPAISPTLLPSSPGCTPTSGAACVTAGVAYQAALTVTNPPAGTPVWSFAAGSQPPGLGINSASGMISGSPTTPGLYTFTIAATYGTTVITAQYSVAITGSKLTIVAPLSLPAGTTGVAITSTVFTASGGVPFIDSGGNAFYHWTIAPGSQPDGLVMDQNSGTLTGTPFNAGIFSITIGVIDAVGTAAIHLYSFNVSGSNSLTITTTSLPGGIVNQAYSQALQQTGGPASTGTVCPNANATGTCWSILSGNLPPGLGISTNTDGSGTISGTPTAGGTYNFTVQASYQVSNLGSVQVVTGSAALSITITTQLTMANPAAVSGFVNQTVTMQFTAVNGTAPYTYSVKSGTLPPGTSLNTQTGAVSGPATSAQGSPFTFTIQVTDAGKQTATAQGTITITTLSVSPTLTPTGTVTAAGQPAVTLTLGSAPGAALSGTLVLTFASTATANAGADNMEVRFSDSTRMVSFTVNADGTVTLPAGLAIITGTVEGKGTIVANFLDPLNLTGTPLASTTVNFTVSAAVPVITSFTIACSGTTYTATVVGYSTTLDMTSVTFTFTPTSGTNLATPSVTVQNSVPQAFAAWWSSSQAATTGSQFTLAVQLTFMVTGGASTNPIVAATAAMTNSQGSTPTPLPSAVPTPACS